jgi:hypothetical protein
MVAWADAGQLYVAETSVSTSRPSLRRIDAPEQLAGLAFTGEDTLAVLLTTGELRLMDPISLSSGWSLQLKVAEPDTLRTAGRYIAVASRKSRQAAVIAAHDARSASLVEVRTFVRPFDRVMLSQVGRIVVLNTGGTMEGVHDMPVPAGTCCIDFRDEETYVAAGDFGGILHLKMGAKPEPMSLTHPGVIAMASTPTWVALAYHDRLELRTYRVYTRWKPIPPEVWTALAVTGALGLLILWKMAKKSWIAILLSLIPVPPVGPVLKWGRKPKKPLPAISDARKELQDALANRTCVLVTGEDLSKPVGMPVWQMFLIGLVDCLCDERIMPASRGDKLRAALRSGEVCAAEAALRHTLRASDLPALQYAHRLYTKPAPFTQTYESLLYLPFCAALTPNLDRLTERVIQAEPVDVFVPEEALQVAAKLHARERFVLKLRGSFDRPDTVTVWPEAAADNARDTRGFPALMRDLLTTRTLLFVGMPLEDIERWVSTAGVVEPARRHIALVFQVTKDWKTTARDLKLYGIEVMVHSPDEPERLIAFLSKLDTTPVARSV